ncbi:MAG: DUF362 domain-containing protein [Endomicrobiia bacterium]|nr:DUF362 domain-containing protein [Endomicrobiaceae bacterium]MDD3053153.1 DUF362 domain-containing protein [Endomicrobiaceae bacterium]MDD3922074.1 DUF362 domain-containing protein [Endomicrobiaceae bacterium]
MLKTIISAYYCDNYDDEDNVQNLVDKTIKSLGNISDIIKPKTKILIKPNLLSAYTPNQAVTTHPTIVRAVVRLVKSLGAVPVIGDSPGNLLKGVEYVWKQTGMLDLAREEQVELINFETAGSIEVSISHPTIKYLHMTKALIDCDGIINIPKLKTHTFMGFTCGIKNFYGCIPGARKIEYHKLAPTQQDFSYLLSEIYRMLKEKVLFTLVDGVIGLEGNGPSLHGEKRKFSIIAGSYDTVTLDTFILNAFGVKNNVFLKPLKEKQLGNTDLHNIIFVGDKLTKFDFNNIKFPVTRILNMIPRWLAVCIGKYIGKLFWLKPSVDKEKCVVCLQCVRSCPVKAISIIEGSIKPFVNRDKCISCFCCHELCTHKAINIDESFLAKIFIK